MFLVIQNDTVNINDISRISRYKSLIRIYFISRSEPAEYHFDTESDATEVEYKIFKNLEGQGLIV